MTGDVDEITALQSPADFIDTLIDAIESAESTIVLSALYLGYDASNPCEKRLLDALCSALRQNSDLQLTLIFDYSRAQRSPFPAPLQQMLKLHPHRCKVLLYQMPQLRHWFVETVVPKQLQEIIAVYHCKFCIFDETKVLLSGANLSEEYFNHRQDRYFLLQQHCSKGVASNHVASSVVRFLVSFTALISQHCHEYCEHGELLPPRTHQQLCDGLQQLLDQTAIMEGSNMTQVTPLIQHASLGIETERNAFFQLLDNFIDKCTSSSVQLGPSDDTPHLHLSIATPYSSFHTGFVRKLLALSSAAKQYHHKTLPHSLDFIEAGVNIIVPTTESHGFGSARGIKSFVPHLHRTALLQTISRASSPTSNRNRRRSSIDVNTLSISQYGRSHWTFHCKGLWAFYTAGSGMTELVAYIGSSNFGSRSWRRDFELGFLLRSREPQLIRVFSEEYKSLIQHCAPLNRVSSNSGSRFHMWFARAFYRTVRSYL